MAHGFVEGMHVNTKFGKGEILRIGDNQATVFIFDRNTAVKIPVSPQFIWTDGTISAKPTANPPGNDQQAIHPLEEDQLNNHKALHSLRFGLVPHHVLQELTFGFKNLEEWVLKYLPESSASPKVAEVYGQYGTGKSHTMAVVRHVAKCEGFVTARVEVDGKGVSLADPEKLLSNLWSNLEAKGLNSATPLIDLYCRAIENGHRAPSIAPRGIDRISDNYQTIELLKNRGILELFELEYDAILSSHDEITASELQRQIYKQHRIKPWDAICVKRMIGRSIEDRPYDFVESLFGHAIICKLAGYKGLVVTIDEFEVERFGNFGRVEALIAALTDYLTGDTSHPWAPCALFFATLDQPGHQGDEVVDRLIEACGGGYYPLVEMDWSAMKDIGERIQKLYDKTYNLSESFFSVVTAQRIFNRGGNYSGRVRDFIKHYLAYLDDSFGPPSN